MRAKKIVIICGILYGIAWFLPAMIIQCPSQVLVWPGYECAIRGLLALFIAQAEIIANPLVMIGASLLLTPYKKTAAICAVAALIAATQTFTIFKVDIWLDEGGANIGHLISLGPGFYLWYASIILVAAAALVRLRKTAE